MQYVLDVLNKLFPSDNSVAIQGLLVLAITPGKEAIFLSCLEFHTCHNVTRGPSDLDVDNESLWRWEARRFCWQLDSDLAVVRS